jgi:hypothetical protein
MHSQTILKSQINSKYKEQSTEIIFIIVDFEPNTISLILGMLRRPQHDTKECFYNLQKFKTQPDYVF